MRQSGRTTTLQQTAAANLALESSLSLSAAAAAELVVRRQDMSEVPSRALFEDALRRGTFRDLANELRDRGFGQAAIYLLFESFALMLRDENREADAEAVEDGALDYIWGWCSKSKMWFDEGLTDEKLNAFREANKGSLKLV